MRVTPNVVRPDIPLQDEHDLPQISRYLVELATQLRAFHQAEHLNGNAKMSEAYAAIRNLNRKLKKEYPR